MSEVQVYQLFSTNLLQFFPKFSFAEINSQKLLKLNLIHLYLHSV